MEFGGVCLFWEQEFEDVLGDFLEFGFGFWRGLERVGDRLVLGDEVQLHVQLQGQQQLQHEVVGADEVAHGAHNPVSWRQSKKQEKKARKEIKARKKKEERCESTAQTLKAK